MGERKGVAMAEMYTGEIRNGVVVFEGMPPDLPEGARVRVEVIEEPPPAGSLADRLRSVIGQAHGLPPDLAEQHDHYLHGQPKR
jgi:hypothetical protein